MSARRTTDLPAAGVARNGQVSERLSLGVAARLARYLQVLIQARKMGRETISSQDLASWTHVNSTQIRRDLSGFGKFGKRGVGYNVDSLVAEIRKILRTSGQHNIALFGAGNLGQAIATSDIFADHGFRIVSIFDVIAEADRQEDRRDRGARRSTTSRTSSAPRRSSSASSRCPPRRPRRSPTGSSRPASGSSSTTPSSSSQVPPEVTVHTSSPAVDLLYALYFYLA